MEAVIEKDGVTGDAEREAPPAARASPSEDPRWRAAFVAHATPALRRRLVLEARRRLAVSATDAEEAFQDALGDVWLGRIVWNEIADAHSLGGRVWRAMRSRLGHARERAQRHVVLRRGDWERDDEREPDRRGHDDPMALASAQSEPGAALEIAQVLARLRELASTDHDVLAMLDALEAEATDRTSVMEVAGLSARQYAAARVRLDRLLGDLPQCFAPRVRPHLIAVRARK